MPEINNLKECIKHLELITVSDDIQRLKNMKESDIVLMHFGWGGKLRNTLNLWKEDCKLHLFFKGLGIFHADDMSGIIMTSFYRHSNGKEIDLGTQVRYYKDFWKTQNIEDYNTYCKNFPDDYETFPAKKTRFKNIIED